MLIFDKNGKRIASIYFDRFGEGGTINGHSGTVTHGIYEWAKSLLRGVSLDSVFMKEESRPAQSPIQAAFGLSGIEK